MMEAIHKLFFPSYTDKKVERITAANEKVFIDTARAARRHRDLLRRNGVTLQIMVAAVGDKHD